MTRSLLVLSLIGLLASCRSTRPIQTAIARKDTGAIAALPAGNPRLDSLRFMQGVLRAVDSNRIDYQTFNAKVNVDYSGSDGKKYDLNASVRMYRDSAIWISANALLGIEALRVLITRDSVKLMDKLNKTYTARSVDYLQEVTALPLDLSTLQDLIIGNPVFLDTNVVSYSVNEEALSLITLGRWFRNRLTLAPADKTLLRTRLEDVDPKRSRAADLTYSDYEDKRAHPFATKRVITVTDKNRLDIRLDFKQINFGEEVSFPFNVPKNYTRN